LESLLASASAMTTKAVSENVPFKPPLKEKKVIEYEISYNTGFSHKRSCATLGIIPVDATQLGHCKLTKIIQYLSNAQL
jgi:hypothetical protein